MGTNRDFDAITFDCYGTLIDWETGIHAAFRESLKNLGLSRSEESRLFDRYLEEEKRIEWACDVKAAISDRQSARRIAACLAYCISPIAYRAPTRFSRPRIIFLR